jgi:hypothetical protein
MVRDSASAFMCATISSAPLAASVVTQVTSPAESNFGCSVRVSSTSVEAEDSDGGDTESLVRLERNDFSSAHSRESGNPQQH